MTNPKEEYFGKNEMESAERILHGNSWLSRRKTILTNELEFGKNWICHSVASVRKDCLDQ